jgi:hypothetical protein
MHIMSINKEELKKLSPKERIKRLKELGQERKKEIEETEDLIKRTEAEIEHNKNIPDIEVPEIEPVDISKMFETPEGLETAVKKESPEQEESNIVKYDAAVEFGNRTDYVEPDEHDWVNFEMNLKVDDTSNYHSATEKAEDLTGSKSALKKIKKYTRG